MCFLLPSLILNTKQKTYFKINLNDFGLALCVNFYIVELCTVTKKYPINTIDTLFHQKLLGELFLRVK